MSGFAVEEQTQPHLINNIIVLLHTTIKTHPLPSPLLSKPPPFFFPFFLFRALAACCPVAWLNQSDTATIHRNKKRAKSQKVNRHTHTHKTTVSYQTQNTEMSGDAYIKKIHTVYSRNTEDRCFFKQLWKICNLNTEQMISMAATSEAAGGEIYLHLSLKTDIRV